MTARSWIDDEPPASASVRQAVDLLFYGLRRPFVLLLATTLFAGLVVGVRVFAKRSYAPSYVLRIVEADRDPTGMPRPRRQFANYVREAVFTSAPLLAVMARHGLYPSLARKNPRAALESFREDIDVDVFQNYFVEERAVGSVPRSARLRIAYRNSDPEVAVSVTRELGALIADHEMSARREQASRAAERAEHEVDAARGALVLRRSEVALEREELDRLPGDPRRQVAFVGLLGSLPALELRQDEAERRAASLVLGAALERRGIGMSFVVVDDASLSSAAGERQSQILLALASLALGLPLVTMAVGAFGPRKGRA